MEYFPITCVWEVTMGCNMRCGHCGSSCKNALPGELSTDEALDLADQIGDLGMSWVTLSGGEPLTRKDLPLIIKRLSQNDVKANIITNGWEMTKNLAETLKNSGVSTVAISIDGTKEVHDRIRRPGAFDRAREAFEIMDNLGIYTASITTISKENIGILKEIQEELIKMKVKLWQLQIGLPMGNFKKQDDWLIDPWQVDDIIDFCYDAALDGRIQISIADCIGYCDVKTQKINSITQNGSWGGCNAGVRSFGILHNGDILGCTSIRDRMFVEGNIRERRLKDIWNDPKSFLWRRSFKKSDLKGDCAICKNANECLGGCPNTRLTTKGSIYEENIFCSFNVKMKKLRNKLKSLNSEDYLNRKAIQSIKNGIYQQANLILKRSLDIKKSTKTQVLKDLTEVLCGNLSKKQFLIMYKDKDISKTFEETGIKKEYDELFKEEFILA